MRDYSGYIIGAVILGMGILSFPLTAENNLIPGILGKRDFDFDYAYFHETAVEVLDHYSPDWKNDYPPSSPVIASVNYETNESREKIVIVLFEGFDGGFANVIFLVDNRVSGYGLADSGPMGHKGDSPDRFFTGNGLFLF